MSPSSLNLFLTWTYPIKIAKAEADEHCFIFLQRIQLLITPCDSLPKTKREQEKLLAIFAPDGDASMNTNGYYPVPERDSSLWAPPLVINVGKDTWGFGFILDLLHPCLHPKDHSREIYITVSHHSIYLYLYTTDVEDSGDNRLRTRWICQRPSAFRIGSNVIEDKEK